MIALEVKVREIKRILENREENRKAIKLANTDMVFDDLLNDANNAATKQELITIFTRKT